MPFKLVKSLSLRRIIMKYYKLELPLADDFSSKLFRSRRQPECILPVKKDVHEFADKILALLFPHFSKKVYHSEDEISAEFTLLKVYLEKAIEPIFKCTKDDAKYYANEFFAKVPDIHRDLLLDAEAIYKGDPAAYSIDEVILTYPGFFAIALYRIAHEFCKMKIPLFPRLISEYAHKQTGIDIHPSARIGKSFCIDHGTGIVIGETTDIGDNVKIYQGVTLGALSVDKKMAKEKRHPTIGDNVVIYAGATILGGKTKIGHDSIVGGNVWLTKSLEPFSVVYNLNKIDVRNSKEEMKEALNFVI